MPFLRSKRFLASTQTWIGFSRADLIHWIVFERVKLNPRFLKHTPIINIENPPVTSIKKIAQQFLSENGFTFETEASNATADLCFSSESILEAVKVFSPSQICLTSQTGSNHSILYSLMARISTQCTFSSMTVSEYPVTVFCSMRRRNGLQQQSRGPFSRNLVMLIFKNSRKALLYTQ